MLNFHPVASTAECPICYTNVAETGHEGGGELHPLCSQSIKTAIVKDRCMVCKAQVNPETIYTLEEREIIKLSRANVLIDLLERTDPVIEENIEDLTLDQIIVDTADRPIYYSLNAAILSPNVFTENLEDFESESSSEEDFEISFSESEDSESRASEELSSTSSEELDKNFEYSLTENSILSKLSNFYNEINERQIVYGAIIISIATDLFSPKLSNAITFAGLGYSSYQIFKL